MIILKRTHTFSKKLHKHTYIKYIGSTTQTSKKGKSYLLNNFTVTEMPSKNCRALTEVQTADPTTAGYWLSFSLHKCKVVLLFLLNTRGNTTTLSI